MTRSDLILSARVGANAALFADILRLHVPPGATVADVTYGQGAFWREVPDGTYRLLASDLKDGIDCSSLPYPDASLDALVLDPPYIEGLFRPERSQLAGSGTHGAFRRRYSSGTPTRGQLRGHAAVLDLYYRAGGEAARVLRAGGVFVVKCMDEVSAGRQRLTHVELLNHYTQEAFLAKDLFVLVRTGRPCVSRLKRQLHARKNHSYFLVLTRRGAPGRHIAQPPAPTA